MRLRWYICLMIVDGAIELPMLILAEDADIFTMVLVVLQITISLLQCLGYFIEHKCTYISQTAQRRVQVLNCVTFTMQMIIQFELFFNQKCTIEVLRILTIMWLVNPIYGHQKQHLLVFAIAQTIILQAYTMVRLGISIDDQLYIIRFSLFGIYTLIMIYCLLRELAINIKYSQAVNSMDNSVQTKETMLIEDLIIENLKVGVLVLNQELDVKVINNYLCKILGTTEDNVIPELHRQLLFGLQQNGEAIQQTDIIKGRVSKRHLSMKANNNVIQRIVKSAEKQLKKMTSISEKVLEMQSKDRRRTRQQTQQSTFEQLFLSFFEKERIKQKQSGLGICSKLKVSIQVGDAQKQFQIEFCQQSKNFDEIYYVLFMYDITKIEILQGQLQLQQFKTLHFNSFSHELRTPLNCSLSLLQAMESQNLSTDIRNNYLQPSIVANKLLMHQINDILDYAQFGFNSFKLNIQQCSITKLFQTLEEYYSQACRMKGIHLKFEIRSINKVTLHSDMERMLQLSVNLLNNSIKFTPQGGQITMIAQQKRHSAGFMNEQWYKIIVHDTGCGINQLALQAIKDILKPLSMKNKLQQNSLNTISQLSKFTAKYIGLGFTIGSKISSALAMCEFENLKIKSVEHEFTKVSFLVRNWANSLDGMISEHSGSERKESSIEYPEKEQDIIPQAPIHQQSSDLPQILICDDVAFNIMALQMLFQSLGHQCDIAHDGRQAITLVSERQQHKIQQYKLIMMDIEMPVINGYEATFEILQINKDINIVMCSAYDSSHNIQEAKECGMKMSITKPVKIEKLKEVVTKFIH